MAVERSVWSGMSESLEKEGTGSTVVSALSAWFAIGTGLALLCLAFLGVLLQAHRYAPSTEYGNDISDYLVGDIASAKVDTVQVSDDGKSLKLLRRGAGDGSLFPVIYSLSEDDQILTRESGTSEPQRLGQHADLRFAKKDGMLEATWSGHHAKIRETWSLNRWGKK